MHVVVVSSPGAGAGPHWSHEAAAALAAQLDAAGHGVTWLAVTRAAHAAAPVTVVKGTVERWELALPPARSISRPPSEQRVVPVERELSRRLRARTIAAVVHVGLGARGSPNVPWLAERLGALPFAFVRAAEVVCHRGDLVDRDARACTDFLDAERCRRCCRRGWWSRLDAVDFRNRAGLLAASLFACDTVFVPAAVDAAQLEAFGVAARSLLVVDGVAAVAARIIAAAAAPRP